MIHIKSTRDLGNLKGISCGYLNIRSLFKYHNSIKILLTKSEFYVLLLGETFLNNTLLNDIFQIEGYNFFRAGTKGMGKREGVALLILVINMISKSYQTGVHAHEMWNFNGCV